MEKPLLSICIPTYKRPEILRNTLNSIYSQNVNQDLFEVCISDDSPTDETEKMIEAEFSDIDNLFYHKTPECGFLNLYEALKLGNGRMLKLLNDYASVNEGSLEKILSFLDANVDDEPLIFFGLNSLKNRDTVVEFSNYNDFIRNIDYQCTFCSSISIWKSDFDRIVSEGIDPSKAFPHTTLLFRQTYKTKYIVDNTNYLKNQPLTKKGGYNLPEYFVKEYLTMVEQYLLSPEFIDKVTYEQLEHSILKFTANWYWNVKCDKNFTFSFERHEKIVEERCGVYGLRIYRRYICTEFIKRTIKGCFRKLFMKGKAE